jgi:hypothetical protein
MGASEWGGIEELAVKLEITRNYSKLVETGGNDWCGGE